MKKRTLLASFILGLSTVVLAENLVFSADFMAVPEAARNCIPTEQVARAEPIASVQKTSHIYYLMSAYEQGDSISSDLLISTSGASCKLLLYNPAGDVIPLSRFVEVDVARQLEVQRLQLEIDRFGGKQKYQQELQKITGETYWTPEQVWAMQHMGLQLPRNIKIISPESIEVSE